MKKLWRNLISFVILAAVMISVSVAGAAGELVLANFEGGVPEEWFNFFGGSTVNTGTQVVSDTDPLALPGQAGDNEILTATYDVFDFGGFGRAYDVAGPQNWIGYGSFDFWFYGSGSGLAYQAEISDNRSDPSLDTSERFDYVFIDDTPGWKFISIPFADFTRATDFQPAGAPDDGFTLTEIWAWAIVLPQTTDTVHFDNFELGPRIVDDFEAGLPIGADADGNALGFFTFNDPNSSVGIATTDAPPAPVPGSLVGNNVLQIDTNVNGNNGFAGVIHAFENDTLDIWTPQDWSAYEGFSFWLFGNNTGSILFVDILDNRNPGSTTDDAERFSVNIIDDFSGWQYFEIPFTDFNRKEVGNSAPNDGFTLTEVHGWAFGVFDSGLPFTNYMDDVALYGIADVPDLLVSFEANEYEIVEGGSAVVTVRLSRELGLVDDDPLQVSVDYSSAPGTAVPNRDYAPVSGTLTFLQGGATSQSFTVPTFENPKHDGDKTAILRLSNPADIEIGVVRQSVIAILDDEPLDPDLLEDFERGAYLWNSFDFLDLPTSEIDPGDPLALPGQTFFENILDLKVPDSVDIAVQGGLCNQGNGVIPVVLLTTPSFNALNADHSTVMFGEAFESHRMRPGGPATRHEQDFDGDGDIDLVFHFRFRDTGYTCSEPNPVLGGYTFDGQPFVSTSSTHLNRDFAIGQNWTFGEALRFWYYGTNSGEEIVLTLKDNRAPDPGPSGWEMVWSDEFNTPAGTAPNPDTWSYEIGDGAANRIPGWGNQELQYYTGSTENSATDGQGNLVITLKEATGGEPCYYGDCDYTSARLISQYKAEFAYGRIESRILVPSGDAGLWPAFWSLGTDIAEVDWPQTGEIDFMEYVSRLPNEIFGTIHGPGYSGGQSYGGIYDFGQPVYNQYHTFAVEWEPNSIKWYVDGILYHTATPANVAPNPWVFNDPVFLIFNMAIGGNFGGAVSPNLTFPQEMKVDYVRVYQGPDTAERFEASFTDNFSGWQQVVVPFSSLVRAAEQPAGAPDDGLGLSEVWGFGLELPNGIGAQRFDQFRLDVAPPSEIVVTNLNNSGDGSLRKALADIAAGGTITFDPALAGGTISLTTGPLIPSKDVTVDAADAPGLALDGGAADRILIVDAGRTVTFANLTIQNGFGFQLAGGVLNNGNLTLDHVAVSDNTMTTNAPDFWQGGGGIYNGEFATLNLVDSTVANNSSGHDGGGVFAFFNTQLNIERSTISGNTATNVGGGLRLLGNADITNTTISNNQALAWLGGALFLTDGVVNMLNTTVAQNSSPASDPAVVFVGTFGPGSATLNLTNTMIADNTAGCFLAPFGPGAVAINSLGNNLFTDGSCFPVASDLIVASSGLDALADNGGPTLTHALLAGSPAIDAANGAVCPTTDQRGVARPQGPGCDIGAFEAGP